MTSDENHQMKTAIISLNNKYCKKNMFQIFSKIVRTINQFFSVLHFGWKFQYLNLGLKFEYPHLYFKFRHLVSQFSVQTPTKKIRPGPFLLSHFKMVTFTLFRVNQQFGI